MPNDRRIFVQFFAEQLSDKIAGDVIRGWAKTAGGDDKVGARQRFPRGLLDIGAGVRDRDLPGDDITEVGEAAAKPLLMRVENTPEHEFTAGVDDLTGEALMQRDDDREEIVRHRLQVYQDQTRPLVDFYRNLHGENAPQYHAIAGVGSVDSIREAIFAHLHA